MAVPEVAEEPPGAAGVEVEEVSGGGAEGRDVIGGGAEVGNTSGGEGEGRRGEAEERSGMYFSFLAMLFGY